MSKGPRWLHFLRRDDVGDILREQIELVGPLIIVYDVTRDGFTTTPLEDWPAMREDNIASIAAAIREATDE